MVRKTANFLTDTKSQARGALWTVDRDSGRGQWTVDGGQGRGQWSGKSEQESQEELRMFLDDLSFVNSV